MNKTARRIFIAGLAAAAAGLAITAISQSASGPSAAQQGIQQGWDAIGVDTQVAVCAGWQASSKSVEAEFVRDLQGKGYTASDVHQFLAGTCK